ncbi:uncharacterized protein JCM10292_007112 [Rhodotorula paludigena]|uniref:uncharacterized protein n=1 Tax=Rhodotorula paludigena TaxID=86838 RepID=UPI003180C1D9
MSSAPNSHIPGVSPPRQQTSLADSSHAPTQQQCLTPPTVRRREQRIARCVAAGYGGERRRERAGGEDNRHERAGDEGEGSHALNVRTPAGYAAEEVEARRVGRRAAAWQGWEAEAARYAGPRVGDDSVLRPDGTVDWDRFAQPGRVDGGDGLLALGQGIDPTYEDLLSTLEAPAMLPPARPIVRLPTLPPQLPTASLPPNTLPLVLGALYIAARAFGLGSRRSARAAGAAADAKVRQWERERNWRE